jgi:hypothetical protein
MAQSGSLRASGGGFDDVGKARHWTTGPEFQSRAALVARHFALETKAAKQSSSAKDI